MAGYRAILVDDEELARNRLRKLLAELDSVDLVAEAANPFQCLEMINSLKPDVLFLDIQMPGLNGFELIQQIPQKNLPLIIFVTAYDHYALKAFDSLALDYLLKPIRLSHVQKSVRKLKSLEGVFRRPPPADPETETENPLLDYTRRFVVKEGRNWDIIEETDIELFFAEEKYCFLRAKGMDRIIDFTLQEIEQKVDPSLFIRVHRATIIALKCIKSLKSLGSGRYEIFMSDGSKVISSRSYSQLLKSTL
jgi:two-component system, LytTR family, response regulator